MENRLACDRLVYNANFEVHLGADRRAGPKK